LRRPIDELDTTVRVCEQPVIERTCVCSEHMSYCGRPLTVHRQLRGAKASRVQPVECVYCCYTFHDLPTQIQLCQGVRMPSRRRWLGKRTRVCVCPLLSGLSHNEQFCPGSGSSIFEWNVDVLEYRAAVVVCKIENLGAVVAARARTEANLQSAKKRAVAIMHLVPAYHA
jgi:hypothetical protein